MLRPSWPDGSGSPDSTSSCAVSAAPPAGRARQKAHDSEAISGPRPITLRDAPISVHSEGRWPRLSAHDMRALGLDRSGGIIAID